MDYLTKYYKNLSEELERRVNLLQKVLMEMDTAVLAPGQNEPGTEQSPWPRDWRQPRGTGGPGGPIPPSLPPQPLPPPPPPPPPPAPTQPSPFIPQTPTPQQNNPMPGAPNQQGPMWDQNGDGFPDAPPGDRPIRQPGEPPEEYQRRVFDWEQERKAYQEYLRQLREFNRQREKERQKKKRP